MLPLQTIQGSIKSGLMPYAFTEQGLAMLSGILKSQKAIEVNITIMRTFVYIRQYALSNKDLTNQLRELEIRYDKKFQDVFEALNYLPNKDQQLKELSERKRIGYKKIMNLKNNCFGRLS